MCSGALQLLAHRILERCTFGLAFIALLCKSLRLLWTNECGRQEMPHLWPWLCRGNICNDLARELCWRKSESLKFLLKGIWYIMLIGFMSEVWGWRGWTCRYVLSCLFEKMNILKCCNICLSHDSRLQQKNICVLRWDGDLGALLHCHVMPVTL